MKCRTANRRLMRSLDAPLDPERKRRLDAHVAACPACRAFRSRAELVRSSLAATADPNRFHIFMRGSGRGSTNA